MSPPRLLLVLDDLVAGDAARFAALFDLGLRHVGEHVALLLRVRGPGRAWLGDAPLPAGVGWRGDGAEARARGAAGVHWPEAVVVAGQADRGGLGWATAAAHDAAGLRRAAAVGADAAVLAPVFAARSKEAPGMGLDAFGALVAEAPLPVLALGGVTPERVEGLRARGAWGVAVLGGWCLADDPSRVCGALVAATRPVP